MKSIMESPAWYTGIPFVVVLLLIAVMPLAAPHFWDKNRNKAIIMAAISLPMLYYLVSDLRPELWHTAHDYVSFIILLGSLFIISGGILMTGDVRATPRVNTMFLIAGAILANFIGTTGASMLLIRPVLRTNSERKRTAHIPVFFIFVVSNIGGCLTPLGDPPLFLGYLKGVPFFWTLRLLPEWLVTLAIVLTVFYFLDRRAYHKESPQDITFDARAVTKIGFSGLINLIFLAGVILSVAMQIQSPYRELIMVAMTGLSLAFTNKQIRTDNKFSFYAINEVAVIFAGIFVTMVPLLTILRVHGAEFGIAKPWQFFWLTGGLSSFLDNAPTYLTFFSLAQGVTASFPPGSVDVISGVSVELLRAISCGAVFMGANTYIGNGPNFMVKSIAEGQNVRVPNFFMYMVYSIVILLPVFVLVTLVFFL